MSYFNYFNLSAADSTNPYTLDTQDLRRRFLRAQRICHPDTWAQRGEVSTADVYVGVLLTEYRRENWH